MVREIQAEEQFAATPGAHCGFCPFALMCQERTRVDLDSLVPPGRPPVLGGGRGVEAVAPVPRATSPRLRESRRLARIR
jgi:hypothetical protein